jgi:hypothetical protein
MKNTYIISLVLVALVIGGGSFFGGMQYAKATSGTPGATRNAAFAGRTVAGGARNAGGFTSGQVVSKDATSITVKLSNGGSKTVYFSDKTVVSKMATGTMDDVSQDTNVTITGTANSDGSIAATMIQIRPAGMDIPGFGGQAGGRTGGQAGGSQTQGAGQGQTQRQTQGQNQVFIGEVPPPPQN